MTNSPAVSPTERGEAQPKALSDRVQSLRIAPKTRAASRTSALWWLMVIACAGVAIYTSLGGRIPGVPRLLDTSVAESATEPVEDSTAGKSAASADKPAEGKASSSATGPANADAKTNPPGTIVLESKGYVIPEQQILVSPQVSGRVVELTFDAGQQVQQGAVLATLEKTEYEADYERATAQVAAARERLEESQRGNRPDEIRQSEAELAEAKTQLEQARRLFERRRELFQQKIVTPQDLDDAESEFLALTQRVTKLTAMYQLMVDGPRVERKRIAEAELKVAEAELVRAKWKLDNTIIRAPISGTILKKNAELGNLVNPSAFNGSFSLCDIADLSKLEVELDIQERDISKVKPNQKCRIRAEAYPQRVYEGYVSRLMPIANRAKGVVPVRVRVAIPGDEQGQYLKPEMGAVVTFFAETIGSPEQQPSVPESIGEATADSQPRPGS